jgi:hypothetical protein
MRIRLAIPDHLVTAEGLEAALEATALANEESIRRGEVPPLSEAIKRGVRWKPEPYLDGEHFDLAHQVVSRKWGDCDDLAPYLAGELRATGEDPGAVPRVYKSGPDRWHVVVQTSDGQILDPSKWAGMGKRSGPSVSGVCGVTARPMARNCEGGLAVVGGSGRYWARVDLPFPDSDGHIASHSRARSPEEALHRAIAGAIACGESIDSPLCDRARLAGAMLLGDIEQSMEGDPEIGSFFGGLLKKALPIATSFIPGVGPVASMAAKTALSALSKGGGKKQPTPDTITHGPTGAVSVPIATPGVPSGGGGDHPMMLYYHPTHAPGPVVMRF